MHPVTFVFSVTCIYIYIFACVINVFDLFPMTPSVSGSDFSRFNESKLIFSALQRPHFDVGFLSQESINCETPKAKIGAWLIKKKLHD